MVYGLWFMVYGLWCMVYGLWCMVYGHRARMRQGVDHSGGQDACALGDHELLACTMKAGDLSRDAETQGYESRLTT